jgi:hypothetical protein
MNLIDEIELETLQLTGDLQLAENVGTTLRLTIEFLADITGIPAETLIT